MSKKVDQLRSDVLNFVIYPALNSNELAQSIKNKVKNTETWINQATHIGDLCDYLKNILSNRRDTNQMVYEELKALSLTPIEDFAEKELSQYEEFNSIKLVNELKVGELYSGHQISYMARNYDTRTGINILKDGEFIKAVFSKVNLAGDKYDNSWIDQGEILKHAMYGYNGVQKLDTDYNSAILHSDGHPIYIFIKEEVKYNYYGEFQCLGYIKEGQNLYFKLKRKHANSKVESYDSYLKKSEIEVERSKNDSSEVRKKRLRHAKPTPDVSYVKTKVYKRNPDVINEVLNRANGVCERCKCNAPFVRAKDNSPYLEVHHKIQLANGGEDTVENAIAVCPNCHREMHFGIDQN